MKSKSKKDEPKVTVYKHDSDDYIIKYLGLIEENRFNRLLKSLRTYNMMAFKQFHFDFMPRLRKGEITGQLIGDTYHYELFSDETFRKVHGKIEVLYKIDGKEVTLLTITPEDLWYEGSSRMLDIYKGVIIKSVKDKFKVDLVSMIGDK